MKTDIYALQRGASDFRNIPAVAEKVAKYNDLDPKSALRLRLLAEEMICMLPQLLKYGVGSFWIENKVRDYELHLKVKPDDELDIDMDKVLSISKSGKNAAATGILNKIIIAVEYMLNENAKIARDDPYAFYTMGITDDPMDIMGYNGSMAWSLLSYRNNMEIEEDTTEKQEQWDELEKSIIANLADDVIVGIKSGVVDIIIKKRF